MSSIRISFAAGALAIGLATAGLTPAAIAGSEDGNFMVRLQAADVISQDKLKSLNSTALGDLKAGGFEASVSDTWIPALTLTYFLNKNLALEVLCCFSKHHVDLKAPPANAALSGNVAEAWIFPPALTLQYHFDGMGPLKPYVGVGAQYIHFFKEKVGDNPLSASSARFKDAFGPTLQAGIDLSLGGGWYLNADIKKTWLDTEVRWKNVLNTAGHDITAKADLDPLIVSAGVGYRFNLEDLFGGRRAAEPLK